MKIFEQLANTNEPPIRRAELEKMRNVFNDPGSSAEKKEELRVRLRGMEEAFRRRGDLRLWRPGMLDKIDQCFEEHYMQNGEMVSFAFLPDSADNQYEYMKYCGGVDTILAAHSELVPVYARDWFAFWSMWEIQGYAFPVPLGTSKVVSGMEGMLRGYREGIIEVS